MKISPRTQYTLAVWAELRFQRCYSQWLVGSSRAGVRYGTIDISWKQNKRDEKKWKERKMSAIIICVRKMISVKFVRSWYYSVLNTHTHKHTKGTQLICMQAFLAHERFRNCLVRQATDDIIMRETFNLASSNLWEWKFTIRLMLAHTHRHTSAHIHTANNL